MVSRPKTEKFEILDDEFSTSKSGIGGPSANAVDQAETFYPPVDHPPSADPLNQSRAGSPAMNQSRCWITRDEPVE